ncbi:MAG: rubrerythrin [Desulfobacterium sp.]|nr:rubrerythrin [Desulfobacterium sp.]
MNFKSMDEILDFAIEKEREAVAFYTGLSKEETFSGSKSVLKEFADEEKKHEKLLINFKENRETLDDYKFKWISDIKRSNYIVDIPYEKGMPFTDTLRLAMKREEKALQLYNELVAKADDEGSKKIFKMLCQEEAKHKNILETIYDDHMALQGD